MTIANVLEQIHSRTDDNPIFLNSSVGGKISNVVVKRTKTGKNVCKFVLNDGTGSIDCVRWGNPHPLIAVNKAIFMTPEYRKGEKGFTLMVTIDSYTNKPIITVGEQVNIVEANTITQSQAPSPQPAPQQSQLQPQSITQSVVQPTPPPPPQSTPSIKETDILTKELNKRTNLYVRCLKQVTSLGLPSSAMIQGFTTTLFLSMVNAGMLEHESTEFNPDEHLPIRIGAAGSDDEEIPF